MRDHILVCAGGNARGAVCQDTLEQLYASEQSHTCLAIGGSAGAIHSAAFACGQLQAQRGLYNKVSGTAFYMAINANFGRSRRGGIQTLNPLRKKLAILERSRIPEGITQISTVINLLTKSLSSPSHEEFPDDGAWLDAICASCAQPPMMAWEWIHLRGQDAFPGADAGVLNIIPKIPEPFLMSRRRISVLLCSDIGRVNDKTVDSLSNELQTMSRMYEAATDGIFEGDMLYFRRLADEGHQITFYAPQEPPGSPWDATWETMQHRIRVISPEMARTPMVFARAGSTDLVRC